MGELAGDEVKRKPRQPRAAKKSGPDLATLIDAMIVSAFSLVAVATAHEHWLKDREDVIPITGPLKAWVDQLPAKQLKKIEQNLAPLLLVVGCATVIGPDILMEVKLRGQKPNTRSTVPRQGATAHTADAPAGGFREGYGEANGAAGRPDWSSSIPADAAIIPGYDV